MQGWRPQRAGRRAIRVKSGPSDSWINARHRVARMPGQDDLAEHHLQHVLDESRAHPIAIDEFDKSEQVPSNRIENVVGHHPLLVGVQFRAAPGQMGDTLREFSRQPLQRPPIVVWDRPSSGGEVGGRGFLSVGAVGQEFDQLSSVNLK